MLILARLHGVALLIVALFLVSPAHAKRVALVVGNADYANVSKLPNPGRDAATLEAMFEAAGFDVVRRANDFGFNAMRRTPRDFSDHARDAEVAVIFFAGHGIEVGGTNYLIPMDAVLARDTALAVRPSVLMASTPKLGGSHVNSCDNLVRGEH